MFAPRSLARRRLRARRDLEPTCSVRFYIGSGVPSDEEGRSRYQGLPTSIDPVDFEQRIGRVVGRSFPGYTRIRARGTWQGDSEDSVVIEILLQSPIGGSCRALFRRAERVARALAKDLGQQAVFVVATDVRGNTLSELVAAA